jgi:hypothetical protein
MLLARLSWRMLALLCVVTGLGTLVYLLHGVTGMVETLQLRSSVADQLSRALPSVTAAVSNEQHNQVCTVRGVDVYPADASEVPACRTLRSKRMRTGSVVRVVQIPSGDRASRCSQRLHRSQVRGAGVRVLDGSVPKRLDGRTAWLVVTVSAPALDAEVGCSSWTPVICRPAFAEPVLP